MTVTTIPTDKDGRETNITSRQHHPHTWITSSSAPAPTIPQPAMINVGKTCRQKVREDISGSCSTCVEDGVCVFACAHVHHIAYVNSYLYTCTYIVCVCLHNNMKLCMCVCVCVENSQPWKGCVCDCGCRKVCHCACGEQCNNRKASQQLCRVAP